MLFAAPHVLFLNLTTQKIFLEFRLEKTQKMSQEPSRILHGPASKSPKIMKTIGQVFFELCEKHPEKIFQIEADTGESETYAQTKLRSVRLACALHQNNLLSPEDTAIVCTENTIHNIIPILAATFLGARAASIDPQETVEEMAGAIEYTDPRIIFTEEKSAEMIRKAANIFYDRNPTRKKSIKFFIIGALKQYSGDFLRIEDLKASPKPNENLFKLYPQDPFDTAIYVFTSGTTSLPKPVALSHYGVLHGFKCLVDEMDNVKPEVMTHFASLYWISAILLTGVTLAHGGTKVIAPKIPALNLLEIIEKYKITFAFMSNTYTYDITNLLSETLSKHDTSSLYSIIIGGSPMDRDQLKRLRQILPHTKITVGYGSSECAAVSAFDLKDVKGYEEKIMASGKIVADVSVKIVHMETREILGPNQIGEILVKSPYMMKGYHEKCLIKSPLDHDGYLKTGDLGYYDQEEYLFVTDRLNDTFKYKTYQVSPLAIERALLTHPAVKEAIAFNIYDEKDRNHAAALVVLEENLKISGEMIQEYANEKLSEKNKIRAKVWVVDKMPCKTRTGKVRRAKIREEFAYKNK